MKSKLLQIFILLFSISVNAQTTIENFSYGTVADTLTNPTKGGVNWVRHSGSSNPIGYINSSLTYPGYSSSGVLGAATFAFGSGSREDANRPCINYNSGSVYASFLCKISNAGGTTGDYFFHLLDTDSMTQFRGRIFIKNGSVTNTFNIGLNKGTTSGPVYSGNYPIDSTLLVVVKYTFTPGGLANDTAKVYIFYQTSIPSTEPTSSTLTSIDISQGDMNRINAIAIRQGSVGTMTGTIDGIRVSNSWGAGVLPVKLLNFNATVNEHSTSISWSTSSEINNKGFEIEKSLDGTNFENIGFVKGYSNSNQLNNYSFDYQNSESAFYRLKQIDFDGAYEYSNIVSAKNGINEFEILPNPFKDEITISNTDKITNIEIVDLTGKVVYTSQPINNKVSVNTSNLKGGVYYIKVYNNESVITKKIIKSN